MEVFINTNVKYKSSVFSFLFSDPDILRELYCALEGISLPADVPVTINTLSDVLFMDRINDISFEIGGKLVVLIEHQSTINPNMALRLLLYMARVYEKIVCDRKLYSSKKHTIPRPEFFVLYNGADPYPDESILKLSELFDSVKPLGIPEKTSPALELTVKVVNINAEKNAAIIQRCRTLAQYNAFVSKVRDYEKERYSRREAVKKAVIFCRNHDILKEFLKENASEVLNMLLTEWNWDDAKEVWQEEAREEGRADASREIARKMREMGDSPEKIQLLTGLSPETIG
jgi:predicted transposase/invertase (TIGR01784 family)